MTWNVDVSELLPHIVPVMTLWREASGEGHDGMAAVAWVILNRMKRHRMTAKQVCLQKWQFSSMNGPGDPGMLHWPEDGDVSFRMAYDVWKSCLSGETPDPTGGSTLYYATTIPEPRWAAASEFVVQIGKQKFYREP